uniref:ER membrane protein complex subunit 4 n=1 Tax=Haptolina brevifila TaxID=156173 RepID=A0A7S2HY87_9EUKA|mmetsp:Transcript_58945/g.117115  ORF Transcript_58945/g.117115 Transcript_58945/m.117115 type:complete len:175 (+) Transcript_58945:74-598(+)|eukprot:CAMPEP_0174716748 /NCGR_PEP_ID=MMETSP1094-20130205/24628_1 /TAXON_ID=156173 /ORGANISM="Chrysochromulina brevifilum, Strain UTEX LB 985" /LENGTH=174 /DNA_ID=CAMNT_0015916567 /DNA_START=62 /DNA_END=586 /DNA_ORIENTATION=+
MSRHKWAMDFCDHTATDLPSPPGYSEQQAHGEERLAAKKDEKQANMMQLKLKKARDLSWSPIKSFMQMAFMLWMSGSGVHIFSIMITYQALSSPVTAMLNTNKTFKGFEDRKMGSAEKANLVISKLIYVGMNCVAMSGGLYKMSMMGLLPNTPSDWVSFLAVPPNVQLSSGSSA